jgi:hypothetical protein
MDQRSPDVECPFLAWKAVVKRLGTIVFILLFAASAIACALDRAEATASTSQQDGAYCGALNASIVGTTLPVQPALLASSGEVIDPMLDICPLWWLAQSIDHPPERHA